MKWFLALLLIFISADVNAQQYLWRYRTHATDCTALTNGKTTDLCYEVDAQTVYKCVPTAGDCSGSEWKLVSGGGSESTTVSDTTTIDLTLTGSDITSNLIEAGAESVIDLQDLQGAVIDSQVPNTITIDNATTAANLGADGVDALTEVAQGIKTAADDTSKLVVGTAGATDDCAKWDSTGALVSAGTACGSGGASGWTDGGTNVYLTTTTDNVGIGTTTPQGSFDIGRSNIIYVGCSDSIATAITNAVAGDTLMLGSCTYSPGSTLTISKSLNIKGVSEELTRIDLSAMTASDGVAISASNVTISNLSLYFNAASKTSPVLAINQSLTSNLSNINLINVRLDATVTSGSLSSINAYNSNGTIRNVFITTQSGSGNSSDQTRGFSHFVDASCSADAVFYVVNSYIKISNSETTWDGGRFRALMNWNNGASVCGYDSKLYVISTTAIAELSDATDTSYGSEAINCQGPNSARNYGTTGGLYCYFYNTTIDGGTTHTLQTVGRTDLRCDDYAQCYLEATILRHNNIQNQNNGSIFNYGSIHANSIQNRSSIAGVTEWTANIYQTGSDAIDLTGQKGGRDVLTGTRTAPSGGGFDLYSGAGGSATATTVTGTGGDGGDFNWTGGEGGDQDVSSSTTNVGGNGSDFNVVTGDGGEASLASGTNTGGNSGTITLNTGNVGIGSTSNGVAGSIVFKTAGTERMRVDGRTTNIGIGTTVPTSLFVVTSTSTTNVPIFEERSSTTNATQNVMYVLARSTGTAADNFGGLLNFRIAGSGLSSTSIGSMGYIRDGANASGKLLLNVGDNSGSNIPRMVINSSGNVGIGTLYPTADIHIVQVSAADAFRVDDVASDTSPMVVTSDGNVGIGTSAPVGGLVVMNGNVGIGTLSPMNTLTVNGTMVVHNSESIGWAYVNGADNTACDTICVSGCVMGFLNATGTAVTSGAICSDAAADECLCAGPN